MDRHFLVTAGSTREPIDAVRDWGNIFTGQTGFDLAEALLDAGDVTLLTSNHQHAALAGTRPGKSGALRIGTFATHADLLRLAEEVLTHHPPNAVLMTAAVADYAPNGAYEITARAAPAADGTEHWTVRPVQRGKIASTYAHIAFTGVPTVKIIDQVRTRWRYTGYLVKFKLEVGVAEAALCEIAQASRRHSGADLIVANTLEMVRGENAGAWLLGETMAQRVPRRGLAAAVRAAVLAGTAND